SATDGVPEVHGDAAVLVIKHGHRVERRPFGQIADGRVQSAAGNDQQGKAGPGLFVMDMYGASLVDGHGGYPCSKRRWTRAAGIASAGRDPSPRTSATLTREAQCIHWQTRGFPAR